MKSISLYQCEVCGTQYKFSKDAEACEKFHVRPNGIAPIRREHYRPYHEQGASKYPHTIAVVMSDGHEIIYTR